MAPKDAPDGSRRKTDYTKTDDKETDDTSPHASRRVGASNGTPGAPSRVERTATEAVPPCAPPQVKAEPLAQLEAVHLFTDGSKSPAVAKPSCELTEGLATWQPDTRHGGTDSDPTTAAPEGSSASHPAVGGLSASPSSAPPPHVHPRSTGKRLQGSPCTSLPVDPEGGFTSQRSERRSRKSEEQTPVLNGTELSEAQASKETAFESTLCPISTGPKVHAPVTRVRLHRCTHSGSRAALSSLRLRAQGHAVCKAAPPRAARRAPSRASTPYARLRSCPTTSCAPAPDPNQLSSRPHAPHVPAQTMGEEGRENIAEAIQQVRC